MLTPEGAGGTAQDRAATALQAEGVVREVKGRFSRFRGVRRRLFLVPGARRHSHGMRRPQAVFEQTAHSSSSTAPSATALPNWRLLQPPPILIICWHARTAGRGSSIT